MKTPIGITKEADGKRKLIVNGSSGSRLAFVHSASVQRSVPSRSKTTGGREDATQHNKTPFESETNRALRTRENGVWGICRGTVICRSRFCGFHDPGCLECACESPTFGIVLCHKGFGLWVEKCAWCPTSASEVFWSHFHFLLSSAPPRLPFKP